MSKIPRILLDMDDVLVDFDRAVCQLYGLDPAEVMTRRNGEWDLVPSLGTTREEFERWMHDSIWWATLPELPWCDKVLELCKRTADRVTIVSAPMNDDCAIGKRAWLRRKFGWRFTDYELRTDKEALANEDTLLVDDRPLNCGKFTMAGGRALMFPAHGNPLVKYRGDMDYFERMLNRVAEDFDLTIPHRIR